MIRVLFSLLLLVSCKGETLVEESKIITYQTEFNSPDSLLVDIQSKIYKAFIQDILSKKNEKLVSLAKELTQLYKKKSRDLFYIGDLICNFIRQLFI